MAAAPRWGRSIPASGGHGLPTEDLQVLGALLDGWPDERIAARFPGVAVAERVDRGADRLALSSRPRVLLHAAREGLFVPPLLWPVQL